MNSCHEWLKSLIGKQTLCITGSGYPDHATKSLISILCNDLRIPSMAIVDFDPDGIEIFLQFCDVCGELKKLQWLFSDLFNVPKESQLPLTERDQKKVASLLKRVPTDSVIRKELELMTSVGYKIEIEATHWIENLLSH